MPSPVVYTVEPLDLHAHLFRVSLRIAQAQVGQILALPVWIPGSYLIREFAQHMQRVQATSGNVPVPLRQLDKHRWQLGPLPQSAQTADVTVSCEVYAFDSSVRTAWLDARRGFFNGTSLCLRVVGREHHPHELHILPPPGTQMHATNPDWKVATGLVPVEIDTHGFGRYAAPDYATLVDAPVEMGPFWQGEFTVRGVPHVFTVAGAPPTFDGARLLADTRRIVEAAMAFWHGPQDAPPFSRYVFMLNATHDGYGGLEHLNSTALICPRNDLPRTTTGSKLAASDGYTSLLGLISHEYFHTWNVKRMRPAELAAPDLDRENHTELLWFFEGFTSYYDDMLLLRAGLIDTDTYLQLLTKAINQVRQTPGRLVQTVAQASFDAWTRYYRIQENTPNATVSYYTKGALVALCLDLRLRQHGSDLDALMRELWQRTQGGPLTEADVRAAVKHLAPLRTGADWDADLDAWLHSTVDLPLDSLLTTQGVRCDTEATPLAQRLGLRVTENHSIQIKNVMRGSLAELAGMAAGDEWLAVQTADGSIWRIQKLDDLLPLAAAGDAVTAWVARDRQIHPLRLSLPAADHDTVIKLAATPPASGAVRSWPLATA